MGIRNTLWMTACWVVYVAVAALVAVVAFFLAYLVRGAGTSLLAFVIFIFVWTVQGVFLFMGNTRLRTEALWVVHVAVAALVVVVVVFLEEDAREADIFSLSFVTFVWTVLAGALVALSFIDRRRKSTTFTLIGAASSAFVFVSAVAYAPSLYGWDLRPLGWYALLATSVPLLMFADILLRGASLSSRLPRLRHGLTVGAFLALVAGIALQMKVSASAGGFGRELKAALDTGVSEIRFSELTDFEWDSVEIYHPYTFHDHLSKAAREAVDVMTWSRCFEMNDGVDLIVFIDEDAAVYYEVVPRFYYPDNTNPFVRRYGEARVVVEYVEDTEGRKFPKLSFE